MKKPLITAHFWTEQQLGTAEKATTFLSLIKELDGGKWAPDKWSQFEPIKEVFAQDNEARLVREWTEERHNRISNSMLFAKRQPSLLLDVTSWRGRVPDLNNLWFDMEASEFVDVEGIVRLKRIITEFISWSGAVYATVKHSDQCHYRSAPGNPTKRLDQLNWLTFLGTPYIALFGRQRIQGCPFHSAEPLAEGLLLTAAERPDSPSMTESGDALIRLEQCLGPDVFAGPDYPEIACRVPIFDLSQTVNSTAQS